MKRSPSTSARAALVVAFALVLVWLLKHPPAHPPPPVDPKPVLQDPVIPPAFAPVNAKSVSTPPAPAADATEAIPVSSATYLLTLWQTMRDATESPAQQAKLEQLADQIALADIPATLAALNGQADDATTRSLQTRLLHRWAETNPQAVADWTQLNLSGPARHEAIQQVAVTWANRNLTDATAWAKQVPNPLDQETAIAAVAAEATRTDPLAALGLASQLPASVTRDNLVTHAARQWALQAPEAAAAWVQQISDAALRDHTLAQIAMVWSEHDLPAAAQLAVNGIPPSRAQSDAVVGITQRWVQTDPHAAANWVSAFPEGGLRDTALENLVKIWTAQNSQQAAEWIAALPAGQTHDLAAKIYAAAPENKKPRIP